ncbi:uncharacterized protein [Nicotiana sylvestris]|uniref:uncharacterized protein n=1 Tax=Nicotiana sylvestris TaxID=4096 RepID=UPI00388C3D64
MDFVVGLPRTLKKFDASWVIVDQLTKVAHFIPNALDKVKVIQERLRTMQSRQKSYADRKVRDVSYTVEEKVLLKVSPMKGVMRFGKKGKLSPRFIGSFETHVLDFNTVQLDGDLTYDVEPVVVLERQLHHSLFESVPGIEIKEEEGDDQQSSMQQHSNTVNRTATDQ